MALGPLWQGRILRACLSDPTGESARALARSAPKGLLDSLPALASFHRVVAPMYASVRGVVPDDVRVQLERLYRDESARRLIALANLERSQKLLQGLAIPFLVVKGPVLSDVIYAQPRMRFYRDLDLVVPRGSFAIALAALEEEGATVVDANWPYFLEHVAGQLDLSTNVDLHWHFLYFEWLRETTNVSMEDVFERARSVTVEGVPLRTPDAADTLIHLAVHACLAGGGRLVWMKDIEQSVVNDAPSWDEVVTRAVDWRVNLVVGTMLLRSRRLLSTPVPDEVVKELVPSTAWRAVLGSLDNAFPITAWTRRETPATRLAEATHRDVRGTLRFLGAAAGRRVGKLFSRSDQHGTAASSDDHVRAAYLERVASES